MVDRKQPSRPVSEPTRRASTKSSAGGNRKPPASGEELQIRRPAGDAGLIVRTDIGKIFEAGESRPGSAARIKRPTREEDAEITKAAAADPDGGLLTDDEFKAAPRVRGPQISPTKVPVSIRLDPDIVEALKADGPGWQSRANDLLREKLKLDS